MNFSKAIILDELLGRLLARFVSLSPPFPHRIERKIQIDNILIIKFWGIGTIIQMTPFIRTLKQHYPNVPIDILTFSQNRQMVETFGLFRKVYTVDYRANFIVFLWQTIRFVLNKRGQYSLIIDFEFFAMFSALITKMLSSKYALGFESFFPYRNRCYSRTISFDHSTHVRMIFFKFLNAININCKIDTALISLQIPSEKEKRVFENFPELKSKSLRLAVNINSGETFKNRQWPKEYFRKLIGFLQQDFCDINIYLVGGKEDLSEVKEFYESLPNKKGVQITNGKLDLPEFSFALSTMKCLITNDSGPLHIAEAMRIPVVCFFGPETPNLYGPMLGKSLVLYKNIYCSPCLNTYRNKRSNCKDNQCLKQILPEDVYSLMKKTIMVDAFQ